MATIIPVQTINGPYVGSADTTPLSTLTWTAADITGNIVKMTTSKVLILFRNSGATPRTVTVPSSFCSHGRKADITAESVAAGAIKPRFFEPHGWEQTFGSKNIEFTASHAEMLIAVIAV